MPRIEDHVQYGDQASVSGRLKDRIAELELLAIALLERKALGQGANALSGFVRCAARQLQILEASPALPIEVAAGACRTAFELYVRTKLAEVRPEALLEFWVERIYDEKSLAAAFLRLTHDNTPASDREPMETRILELEAYIERNHLSSPSEESRSVAKLAKAAGLMEEYKALYNFYSKYTHASSWLVNAKEHDRDGAGYRAVLSTMTQVYVSQTVYCVEQLAASSLQ